MKLSRNKELLMAKTSNSCGLNVMKLGRNKELLIAKTSIAFLKFLSY